MVFVSYIRYLEHIYRFTYFPFALYSPFTRWCGGCADRAKLHRSASLHSRAARERGQTFKVGLLPPHPLNGWSTLLGLPSGRKGCPFPQKPDCYPTSPRTMLPSRFCHMVDDHSQRKLHPLSPAPSIVSLQKADRREPERGSHARFPMVALRWLGCLTLSVSGYAHTYSSIALYLYSLITLLLYSLIMVFIYCYTHLLGYCRIRVFYYCSSYLLLAIRQ